MSFLDNFRLRNEKEKVEAVIESVSTGVEFRGTNLWILVFAIIIASLGLNMNSTAVIIGAMLISPIMGPIMGMGLGMAINDLDLLKRAISNYFFAAGVGLAASTLYFLLSPLNDAHSEILARTSPTIYDVLIAFFGGLAGILATSSKHKGNVIPGAAIATALMPPLCAAGYGLALFKFDFFFGALYLFIINTVFISLATLLTARFLKFPLKQLASEKDETRSNRIIWVITIITLLPSIYLGYDIVQKNKYEKTANRFIDNEATFPNDYLLKKEIDPKKKTITLVYGGQFIDSTQIKALLSQLARYGLDDTKLLVQQGFAYLKEAQKKNEENPLNLVLTEKENQLAILKNQLDSAAQQDTLSKQVYRELKVQYPTLQSCVLQTVTITTDSLQKNNWLAILNTRQPISTKDRKQIEQWLKVRVNSNNLKIYF